MGRMWFHKNQEICPLNCSGLGGLSIFGFYCRFHMQYLKVRRNRSGEARPVKLEKCKHKKK